MARRAIALFSCLLLGCDPAPPPDDAGALDARVAMRDGAPSVDAQGLDAPGLDAYGADGASAHDAATPDEDPPGTWRSELFPRGWVPVHAGGAIDDEGRFMPDFSYAGYHRGEERPPVGVDRGHVVTIDAALGDGEANATSAIRAAITEVCAAGGGAVVLPRGTFRLKLPTADAKSVLDIGCSNFVLRGQGPSETRLLFDDPTRARLVNVISVRGGGTSRDTDASRRWPIAEDLAHETRTARLGVAPPFAEGDWVMVMADNTEAYRRDHRMDAATSGLADLWPESGWPGIQYVRQVERVAGDQVTFTVPLRQPLLVRDGVRVYGGPRFISEVGLEGFSIGMTENRSPSSGLSDSSRDNDYNVSGTMGYQVHANHAIDLDRVHDAWIVDVDSYLPAGNATGAHVLSVGVSLGTSAAHVTIEGSDFGRPEYRGGGGNGYLFLVASNESLILHGTATGARHGYILTSSCSGNVIREVEVHDSRMSDDSHRFLAHANLYDRVVLDRGWLQAVNRGTTSTGGGFTATEHVFWGTHAIANHTTARGAVVESAQWAWGYLIGSSADEGATATLRPESFTNSTWARLDPGAPADWVEGEGEGATLFPHSLHAEQLRLRCAREGRTCVTW